MIIYNVKKSSHKWVYTIFNHYSSEFIQLFICVIEKLDNGLVMVCIYVCIDDYASKPGKSILLNFIGETKNCDMY